MPQDDKRPEDLAPIEDTRSADPFADKIAEAELAAEIEAERPVISERTVSAPPRRRGTGAFLGTVLGGILAAAAGFGLARVIPGGWPLQDTSALETQLAAQADQIAGLQAQLATIADRPLPDPSADIAALRTEVEQRLSEVAADPAVAEATQSLQSALAEIESRLTEVEKRPAGAGGGASATALAAYDRELQELRDQIAAQSGQGQQVTAQIESVAADAKAQIAAAAAEAERLKTEAAATARGATVTAAVGRIRAAMEDGGPFVSAVTELSEASVTVPTELSMYAETGVPTMMELQRTFPDAARTALSATLRTDPGAGWTDRLGSFLRTQTGLRSLEPREGDDPDAVLSRAEAALANGDLPAVLTELDTLPDEAKAAMDPWITKAQSREAANAALTALTAAADAE